jgi:hypothetical protein
LHFDWLLTIGKVCFFAHFLKIAFGMFSVVHPVRLGLDVPAPSRDKCKNSPLRNKVSIVGCKLLIPRLLLVSPTTKARSVLTR